MRSQFLTEFILSNINCQPRTFSIYKLYLYYSYKVSIINDSLLKSIKKKGAGSTPIQVLLSPFSRRHFFLP